MRSLGGAVRLRISHLTCHETPVGLYNYLEDNLSCAVYEPTIEYFLDLHEIFERQLREHLMGLPVRRFR